MAVWIETEVGFEVEVTYAGTMKNPHTEEVSMTFTGPVTRLEQAIEAMRSLGFEEALAKYGKPDIFNTDQGSQFTSFAFTSVLRENGIRISMDGRGRWLDNVFIERLWRSLKYENVYLHAYETGFEARAGIGRWIEFYNRQRPHSSLGGFPPDWCYEQGFGKAA